MRPTFLPDARTRPSAATVRALALASVLACTGGLQAGESQIELMDGSVVVGEVTAVHDGQYRVRSALLGEVSLPESSIRSLRPRSGGPDAGSEPRSAYGSGTGSDSSTYGGELTSIQQQLATNPDLMRQIQALQEDPEIKELLADPELPRLLMSGDLERLRADPRVQRLLENPAIQGIVGQVAR